MDVFNQTQQTVFALLRASLWGQAFSPDPDTDWDAVWTELQVQTTDTLCAEALVQADPKNRLRYLQSIARRVSFWFRLMAEQKKLCALLAEEEIPCAVLKGAAAAQHYPQPTYRVMGDVDLIVPTKDCDRAGQLLEAKGCKLLNRDNFRHMEFSSQGIVIELHKSFSILKNQYGLQVDQTISAALSRAEQVNLEGFSFPVLPALENGMVLLEHINQHMEKGLGLRQIIDWMLYVDACLDDSLWQTEFQALARSIGLETLAVTTTRMCQLYLGLGSHITWCQNADPALCRQLMVYLLEQGNFGRKRGTDHNKTAAVLNSARNFPNLLCQLHRYGRHNWEAAAKYPILIPFSSFYQAFRYARYGLSRENPFRSLAEDLRNSRELNTFFQQLGVLQRTQGVPPVTAKEHQPKK